MPERSAHGIADARWFSDDSRVLVVERSSLVVVGFPDRLILWHFRIRTAAW